MGGRAVLTMMTECREYPSDWTLAGILVSNHHKLQYPKLSGVPTNEYDVMTTRH